MNSGYYAACAGLEAQTQALEMVANNLANLSTSGYRGQQLTFHSLLAGSASAPDNPLNNAINQFGMPGETRIDLSAGNLEQTGNPLDLAVEGSGFLVVQTPAGTRYTRNGNFRISSTDRLTTSSGDLALGEQGPITLPNGPISISADGTLSVNGAVVDKLRLVEFVPGQNPVAEGASYYSADASAVRPATESKVRQGMLESSNVNAIMATVNVMTVQRRFEMMQSALSAFYNTFNRIAADDLPRV